MTVIDKDKLQSFGEGLFAKIKSRFVDKTGENIIAGKTTILNGYIPGGIITSFNHKNTMQVGGGTGHYCGSPHRSIPANRHISHIVFAVKDGYSVGEVIDGINIGVVRTANNEVVEILKNNAKYPVSKNANPNITADKVVVVEIDKEYNEEVYIIFGARGILWNHTGGAGDLYCVGGDVLPQVGTILSPSTGNYIGRFEIYGSGMALRDLANSGTGGVSRGEFEQHVTTNEQQHQALNSSISANIQNITAANNNISSQGQRISGLENNTAKLNTQNTFTSRNVFMENSPIVNKYFSIKNVAKTGDLVATNNDYYYCNPKEELNPHTFVSGIIVPVHNSRPGDRVRAEYFVLDSYAKRVLEMSNEDTYTVQDIQYQGHYCIVFNINKSFTHHASFGFRVRDAIVEGGRRVSLLKQNNNTNGWNYARRPTINEVLNENTTFLIPYAITRRSASEVVTRYDLANNTVPLNIYQVGELKAFAFDLGKSTEIDGKTWLRCEGQVVQQDEDGDISTVIAQDTPSQRIITLPVSESGKYIYVCAY